MALVAGVSFYSCSDDDDNDKLLKVYQEWYDTNSKWLKDMIAKKGDDGKLYYQTMTPAWDPNGYVLMRWINDPEETKNNLSPLSNSTVDVRYILYDCNNVARDSSSLMTEYGPGIFRSQLSSLVPGWDVALTRMHCGDSCEVIVPFTLAYGTDGQGDIPPYSNLRFNIRLVSVYRYELPPGD